MGGDFKMSDFEIAASKNAVLQGFSLKNPDGFCGPQT
jgi:hypothetical protein